MAMLNNQRVNLDVNRSYLYLILIRSRMCVVDISFPLNGPKYVVASPTSTIVSGGQGLLPTLYSYQRPRIPLEFWAENNKHIADLEIPHVLLWHDFSSNNITHNDSAGSLGSLMLYGCVWK